MDPETRRRALRAAAKVAFGAALVGALPGCGGKAELDPAALAPSSGDPSAPVSYPAPDRDAAPASSPADAAVADAISPDSPLADGGLRCVSQVELGTGNPPSPPPPITDAEFVCCANYDNARVSSSADAGQPGPLGSDPSFVNCCRAIIARMDTGAPLGVSPGPAREACCSDGLVAPASELWGHQFCAPWGPPVPPALAMPFENLA